jgi:hypothetical protein
MSKWHIVYELIEERIPLTEQAALCGTLTPTGNQIHLDSGFAIKDQPDLYCKRCVRKRDTLMEVGEDRRYHPKEGAMETIRKARGY